MHLGLIGLTVYLTIWTVGTIMYAVKYRHNFRAGFLRYALDSFFDSWMLVLIGAMIAVDANI